MCTQDDLYVFGPATYFLQSVVEKKPDKVTASSFPKYWCTLFEVSMCLRLTESA